MNKIAGLCLMLVSIPCYSNDHWIWGTVFVVLGLMTMFPIILNGIGDVLSVID